MFAATKVGIFQLCLWTSKVVVFMPKLSHTLSAVLSQHKTENTCVCCTKSGYFLTGVQDISCCVGSDKNGYFLWTTIGTFPAVFAVKKADVFELEFGTFPVMFVATKADIFSAVFVAPRHIISGQNMMFS